MNRLLLPVALFFSIVSLVFAADTPAPLKPFDKTQLTTAQTAACAAFKDNAGKERHTEAKGLAGIFTTPYMQDGKSTGIMHRTALFTCDDIIRLLGKPDSTTEGDLNYNLSSKTGDGGSMIIAFDKDGHLTMVVFVDL